MNEKKSARSTFAILYYLNKSRPNKAGECPIYVRISINGTQTALSIKRNINPDLWAVDTGQPIGNTAAVQELKKYMTAINTKFVNNP